MYLPVRKRIPARTGINAPNPHSGGASIQNWTGTREYKKFIKTAHPARR